MTRTSAARYGAGMAALLPGRLPAQDPDRAPVLLVLAAARIPPAETPSGASAWPAWGSLWLTLLRSKVNIGLRYALLTYPLAIPFVSRLFEARRPPRSGLGAVALAALRWFGLASVASGTRPLSYFNELGGGPRQGWLYLADSNLDWGQDFDALAGRSSGWGSRVTTDLISERRCRARPRRLPLPEPEQGSRSSP